MCESELNKDITIYIMIDLFFISRYYSQQHFDSNTVKRRRLHISAARRMSCQSLTVAVTLLSHRCYVCHSFACNHL